MSIDTLLPKKLDKADDSYKSVVELDEVLSSAKELNIKNIALTGPYGSGKSSVLISLMKDFHKGRNYLPISLATLQANEEDNNILEREDEIPETEKRIDNLNRKIEYSILQQLIYREKAEIVPNSRFRRIVHLSKKKLRRYSICVVLSLICFLILFEPSFAKVDSIYNFFSWGNTWNTIFEFLSFGWLLYILFTAIRYVFRSYSNSKLNKLNLKDAEIEVVENNSIFNRHLDEILYFFQVTEYDVVIIEDLDRFGTPNIFLKLRELNQLINESKIVGRHITFIYAVKDDIFKDEERTKFFDYIITVIPVINPSNSKDKLKSALEAKGCGNEISDEDLSEMAFFIQDMRILTNIANEYKQYRDKLCTTNGAQLNKTKLLAMIVYKNYYPQDFALLHRRQGKVYGCINKKAFFISQALKVIDEKENNLRKQEQDYKKDANLSKTDLRRLFLFYLWHTISQNLISIRIGNKFYSLEEIAINELLFNELLTMQSVEYQYYSGYPYSQSLPVDFKRIDKAVNYSERLDLMEKGSRYFQQEFKRIKREKNSIKSQKISNLIKDYKLSDTDEFDKIGLEPMMNVFIRRGYIDEEYYDYISYFYEGMVSLSDRDLLLAIKTEESKPYDYHIDKIENFVKELKEYMFESDAILNIELLDYLACNDKYNDEFENLMSRLEHYNAPLQFLSQYYLEGKQNIKVFKHYIEYANAWNDILNWNNVVEKENLIEAYLNYSIVLDDEVQEWLNSNFVFLVNHIEGLGLDKTLNLVSKSCFINISNGSDDLLDCVIEYNSYEINLNNIFIIARHLCKGSVSITSENLNYTRVCETQNCCLINYVQQNIAITLQKLKDCNKDESSDSILYILNSPDIDSNTKRDYLNKQCNRIGNFDQIVEASVYDIAVETKVIQPTWQNVLFFYRYKGNVSEILIDYINHYVDELSKEKYPETLTHKEELFASIFGNDVLSVENYKKLLPAFTDVYPSIDTLEELEENRLLILIECGRLPFNQETLDVINNTGVLAEYLICHSNEFVTHLNLNYNFNVDNVLKILKEKRFTLDEKYDIIGILPSDIIQSSPLMADFIINVFCEKEKINIELETLILLVKTCSSKKNKIQIATLVAKKGNSGHDTMRRLINAIGDSYVEVADINKRAKLQNTDTNRALLAALKSADFISNYTNDGENDEFLRVYHKRKSAIQ